MLRFCIIFLDSIYTKYPFAERILIHSGKHTFKVYIIALEAPVAPVASLRQG